MKIGSKKQSAHSNHPEAHNIDWLCEDHAPKPMFQPPLPPPSAFLGKGVKRAFRAKDGRIEHMWVHVLGVEQDVLVGRLANHPLFDCGLRLDDRVTVAVAEIEDVSP